MVEQQRAEVGVDIMWSRVVKLRLGGMDKNRQQAAKTSQGEVEDKRELEAHQQSQSAGSIQRSTTTQHYDI